jgi:hypothetical protein
MFCWVNVYSTQKNQCTYNTSSSASAANCFTSAGCGSSRQHTRHPCQAPPRYAAAGCT